MRVLHTYCLNYNIGDYALGIGLKNALREYLDVSLIGNTNLQGREFNEYYINEVVNKRYDLLVIGGGGVIHGSHWPNGWFWLIDKDLIKTIGIPFIVYGVGDNYFEDEQIPERAVAHLRETYKYASYFSVRNDGSHKRVLEQTGIDAKVVPDPGFHVGLNTEYERPEPDKYIIIQLADDKPAKRFKNDQSSKDRLVNGLREILKSLSGDYKIIFAPHVYDDIALSKVVATGIPNSEIWDFGYFAFDHSDKAIAYYKYAEFVIAMRGHGQIVPIGFNTPIVSIQNHPKHGGLMEELELSEYNIDIHEVNFKDKLTSVIQKTINNKQNLEKQYDALNTKMSRQTEKAFEDINKALRKGG